MPLDFLLPIIGV